MWQELVVGIIVALAAFSALAKYLPAAWRRALVHRLSKGGRQSRLVKMLDTSASCGSGCDSCKTCDTPDPAPAPGSRKVIKIHERR